MGPKQKSLLIINESGNAYVTLNLYVTWDVVCWLPYTSQTIKPNTKLLHSTDKDCKFEIVARIKDKKSKRVPLLKSQQLVENKLIRITDSLDIEEDDLAKYPEEEKECLRKVHRDEELGSLEGGCNLYDILRLNMEEIRAMQKEKQDEEIRMAFIRELRIWHPDFNDNGDEGVVREVIMAYDILQDREKRARYHNMADYDSGWLSVKRFKAVFCPECETVAQRLAWIKRMGLLALSAGLTIAGIVGVVLTVGLSSPLLVPNIMGGFSALRESISKEAIVDGCDVRKWLMKTGIGYLLAAMPGGVAVGVALLQSAALKLGEFLACRAAIGALSGAMTSLVSDAKKKIVDGEEVTIKQAMGHAAAAAAAGTATTMVGIGVAQAMASNQTATGSSANVVGTIKKPVSQPSEVKRLAQRIPSPLAEKGTEVVFKKAAKSVEKRLDIDDSVESEIPKEDFLVCLTQEWRDAVTKASSEKMLNGVVRYVFKGHWRVTKMIVSFSVNGEKSTKQVKGSGKYMSYIHIPYNARKIKVRFQATVRPLPWRDIFKYDRFQNCWCKPHEPHIFQYETPPIRTFIISGRLTSEVVMRVTDEHHNETNEM